MIKLFCTCVVILGLSTVPGLTLAEVYQWTDEHGKVHFGDRPPAGKKAKDLSKQLEKINVSTDFSSPQMMLKMEQEKERTRNAAYRKGQEVRKQQPSKQEWCEAAKKRLWTIQGRVVFLDENGKEIKVSEKQRQAKAAALKKDIADKCQ